MGFDMPNELPADKDEYEAWEKSLKERRCPKCNSTHVVTDGDTVETLGTEGQLINSGFLWWWHCEACNHQFRYQDEKLNP